MKHLTIDEILDFVSFETLDATSLQLATKVNSHIRTCEECFRKVQAFQMIYDEFVRLGTHGNFKSHIYRIVSEETQEQSQQIEEIRNAIGEEQENDLY